jgi:hypothetical protein
LLETFALLAEEHADSSATDEAYSPEEPEGYRQTKLSDVPEDKGRRVDIAITEKRDEGIDVLTDERLVNLANNENRSTVSAEDRQLEAINDISIMISVDAGEETHGGCDDLTNNDKALPALALPEIAIQAASPTVMSPTEEGGDLSLAMEKYTHAWLDMEEVCGKADAEIKAEEHKHDIEINATKYTNDEQGTCHNDVQADEEETEERPLSPADYTLEDDGDLIQVDDQIEGYQMQYRAQDRAPSPSEYSLLVESAEENELNRITNAVITDDVFAIPDPIAPSSGDLSMYLEIQYGKHAQDVELTNSVESMQGTNISACLLSFFVSGIVPDSFFVSFIRSCLQNFHICF